MAARVKKQYTSDDTSDYMIDTLDYIGTAGGLTTVASGSRKPIGMKLRHLNVLQPESGRTFKIPVQATNSLWTGPAGASITVVAPSGSLDCIVTGHSGERRIGG